MNRAESLARLRDANESFEILIVGGGATGLGAAIDAAARGHRVALIEQGDFAQGTSSRSTKLVHGGVRYLKQGNISLVVEALKERGRLARNAPHLVHDLTFVIPSYRWWETPFYGLGMKVYDGLAGKLGFQHSQLLDRPATLAFLPNLADAGLRGGVAYHDGQFDDSRLAVNLAQTAAGLGASVVNYCRCVGLVKTAGRIRGVLARDAESGEEFTIQARVVINATGVFVDDVRSQDEPGSRPLVAASQGMHIVLPKSFWPGSAALMIPKTADGRVLFAVPWHDHVVVGTTDTPVARPAAEPRALDEERDFVMSHAQKYMAKGPTDSDVLSIYAGQRPLVRAGGGTATAALSRDHTILVSQSGLITVTGGKWTTYRRMAEEVIGRAEKVGILKAVACSTQELRIRGDDAAGIEAAVVALPGGGQRLHPALPYRRGEVLWQVRREMARTVEDVLSRRTRALILNASASIEAAPVVAQLMAAELGRDGQWEARQVAKYTSLAQGYVYNDAASRGAY